MDFFDKALFNQDTITPQYWPGSGALLEVPGLPPGRFFTGITAFYGHALLWDDTSIKWSAQNNFTNWIPVGATIFSAVVTVADDGMGNGFTQPAAGATVNFNIAGLPYDGTSSYLPLVAGEYVQIPCAGADGNTYYSLYTVVSCTPGTGGAAALVLKRGDYTGQHAAGTAFPIGTQIFTLDANDAGEAMNIGGDISGAIWQIVPLNDVAYIFKNRSIQSMQFVGVSSGVWYIRPEVVGEGLIARNTFVRIGNSQIIFLGLKELYSYQGGPTPTPICRQFTRQLYGELDRGKLDNIILYHKEDRNEVWIVYPSKADSKYRVLIWNYVEDSAALDNYTEATSGISAIGSANWELDTGWNELGGAWFSQDEAWSDFSIAQRVRSTILATNGAAAFSGDSWESFPPTLAWQDLGGVWAMLRSPGAAGVLIPKLYLHGLEFSNDGAGYESYAETFDFDFGDASIFKYAHTVKLSLAVDGSVDSPKRLWAQLGARDNLDSQIRWTAPKAVDVQGGGQPNTKLNLRASGRYIRARFFSNDAGVEWRLSAFEIWARAGGGQ